MSVYLKPGQLKIKDENGDYTGINTVALESTAEYLEQIETKGDQIMDDIETKGEETLESIPDDYTALSEEVSELNERIDNVYTEYLINGYDEFTETGYYDEDGSVLPSESFMRSETYVRVKPNTTYSLWRNRDNNYFSALSSGGIVWYDANKNVLGRVANTASFTSPNNAAYARCYVNSTYVNYPMFIEGTTTPITYAPFGYDIVTEYEDKLGTNYSDGFANQLNLIDGLSITGGTKEYFLSAELPATTLSGYIGKVGVLNSATGWQAKKYAVEANAIYKYKGYGASSAFALYMYDVNDRVITRIPDTASTGTFTGFVKTPDNVAYIILNEQSTSATLKKVTGINYTVDVTATDILSGKKLYCGGDSITEGAGVGSFSDGYKKTYGGYVAERNGMTYVSDGIGGSTIGNVTVAGSSRHGFCVSRYLDIPADADYITIWFGWNDYAYGGMGLRDAYSYEHYGAYYDNLTDAQKAEVNAYHTWQQWLTEYVGTIDSSDDTTWAGAWNKVLTWLLNNRSNARIGIIIAYGISDALANMLISLCEKYGVSYVKAYDPHEFFSVGHSQGIGTDQATKRKSLYTLDNTHPNELGYEMMSASYEQFLRQL